MSSQLPQILATNKKPEIEEKKAGQTISTHPPCSCSCYAPAAAVSLTDQERKKIVDAMASGKSLGDILRAREAETREQMATNVADAVCEKLKNLLLSKVSDILVWVDICAASPAGTERTECVGFNYVGTPEPAFILSMKDKISKKILQVLGLSAVVGDCQVLHGADKKLCQLDIVLKLSL